MIHRQFITVLFVSIAVTFSYYLIAGKKESLKKFVWPGLIIFAGTWAGGLWLQPFGPAFFGFQSSSYILSGLFFGFIFTLISMRRPPSGRYETLEKLEQMEQEKDLQKLTYTVLKVMMWFLLFILMAAVITLYFKGL
ncbi:MAG: hypothetical protein R6U27_06145 [Desulfobacterales bacterium]